MGNTLIKYWTNFQRNARKRIAHSYNDKDERQDIGENCTTLWPDGTGIMNCDSGCPLMLTSGKLVESPRQQMEASALCDDWEFNRTESEQCSEGYFSILDYL